MHNPKRTKRRILSAGIGVAAFTALEGIACGNPVEPRWRPADERAREPDAAALAEPRLDAAGDAMVDAAQKP